MGNGLAGPARSINRIHCVAGRYSRIVSKHPPHFILFFPIMSDSIKHVSDASFEADVLQSDIPVLVDYWAPWCGPCKMLAPLLEEAGKEYEWRVTIANRSEERRVGKGGGSTGRCRGWPCH